MTTQYKGDCGVQTAPDGGSVRKGVGFVRTTTAMSGKYTDLEAIQPEIGDDGMGGSVVDVELAGKRGGMGVLTVTTEEKIDQGQTGEGDVPLKTTIEIEWQQIEKPLLSHPTFYPDVDASDIDAWKEEPDKELKKAFKYMAGGSEVTLNAQSQIVAGLILKGVESYLVFTPVVKRTRLYTKQPDSGQCGLRGDPPFSGFPDEYVYLKTADQVVQNADNTWTRSEQWTGADEWSDVLYGPWEEPEALARHAARMVKLRIRNKRNQRKNRGLAKRAKRK